MTFDSNMRLTVLVPTANRPCFLPLTLESISNQSAKDMITRVVVSENGGSYGSKLIVDTFKHKLPIEWIFQNYSLTPQQHGIWLASQVTTPLVAQIADDDIWDTYHLEAALSELSSSPRSAAYFGKAVYITDNSCWPRDVFAPPFSSLVSNLIDHSPSGAEIWTSADTAINSLCSTPLNIWSVVSRSAAHLLSLSESAGDPVFGNFPSQDALYIWRLSLKGTILVGSHISLFYRRHSDSDIARCMEDKPHQTQHEDLLIRQEINRQALANGIDSKARWLETYCSLTHLQRQQIPTFSALNLNWLLNDIPKEQSPTTSDPSFRNRLTSILRLLLPPIVVFTIQKYSKVFQKVL
jgi:hypothetical protein